MSYCSRLWSWRKTDKAFYPLLAHTRSKQASFAFATHFHSGFVVYCCVPKQMVRSRKTVAFSAIGFSAVDIFLQWCAAVWKNTLKICRAQQAERSFLNFTATYTLVNWFVNRFSGISFYSKLSWFAACCLKSLAAVEPRCDTIQPIMKQCVFLLGMKLRVRPLDTGRCMCETTVAVALLTAACVMPVTLFFRTLKTSSNQVHTEDDSGIDDHDSTHTPSLSSGKHLLENRYFIIIWLLLVHQARSVACYKFVYFTQEWHSSLQRRRQECRISAVVRFCVAFMKTCCKKTSIGQFCKCRNKFQRSVTEILTFCTRRNTKANPLQDILHSTLKAKQNKTTKQAWIDKFLVSCINLTVKFKEVRCLNQ